ncbi:enoyl-CoA hydratase-related protein [Acinetobacter baumannii]
MWSVLEGAVLGGGFGLACVSDVAISRDNAQFGLPETGLGVIPAQIASFCGETYWPDSGTQTSFTRHAFLEGHTRYRGVGVVHQITHNEIELGTSFTKPFNTLNEQLLQASRVTKALLHRTLNEPLNELLDDAAQQFAQAVEWC